MNYDIPHVPLNEQITGTEKEFWEAVSGILGTDMLQESA